MRRHFIAAIFVLAIGTGLTSLEANADEDDSVATPCSDFLQTADTDSPCTVEARRVLIQLSLQRSLDPFHTTVEFPRAVVRYGASRSVEVRVGLPSVVRSFGDEAERRSTDILLGLKTSAGHGKTVGALSIDATLPTGDSGGGLPTIRAALAGGYALDKRTNLVGSIAAFHGAGEDGPAGTRRTTLTPAAGVEFEPVDGTEFELGFSRESSGGASAHEWELSVQRRIGPRVALRVGAQRRTAAGVSSAGVLIGINALL